MIPRLLVEASTDPKLRGAPLHVLCYLYGTRKYGDYQKVKHLEVAEMIHITQSQVSRALRRLVDEGYLREGPRLERNVSTFMLLFARDNPVKQTA